VFVAPAFFAATAGLVIVVAVAHGRERLWALMAALVGSGIAVAIVKLSPRSSDDPSFEKKLAARNRANTIIVIAVVASTVFGDFLPNWFVGGVCGYLAATFGVLLLQATRSKESRR
jgi:hypothetical protein